MSDKKITHELTDEELNKLTYFELNNLIQDTKNVTEQIVKENNLLTRYIQTWPNEKVRDKKKSIYPYMDKKLVLKQEIRIEETDFLIRENILPIEKKCEIAKSGIENMQEKIRALHQEWNNIINPYKIQLEGLMVESKDLKIDIFNFSRASAEKCGEEKLKKILNYFTHSIKNKETKLERCHLHRLYLSKIENDLLEELKQKELFDIMFDDNDLNQLSAKHGKYISKINNQNASLREIKYIMFLALQYLSQYKDKLNQLTVQEKELKDQFQRQCKNIADLEEEFQLAQNEEAKLNRRVSYLKYQLDNYRVPDLMDYITTTAEMYELNRMITFWQRRANIASRSLDAKSTFTNRLKHIKGSHKYLDERDHC